MTKEMNDLTAAVLEVATQLMSPNEVDANGEAANVVDGLFAIARAIRALAQAVEETR